MAIYIVISRAVRLVDDLRLELWDLRLDVRDRGVFRGPLAKKISFGH